MNNTFAKSMVTICGISLSLAGCATASKDISATYVSPNQYSNYDCDQLAAESARIQGRVVQLGGRLDQAAQNDAGIMAVGLIIFWPALFALGGTKQQEAEYARLRGESDAVEQTSVAKKCARAVPAVQTATAGPSTVGTAATTSPASTVADSVPIGPQTIAANSGTRIATPAAATSSKYLLTAERFAKDAGCVSPVTALNVAASGYETFNVGCAKGDPMLVRCDYGTCRELK